ncbi:hypothetical protein [Candidatus Paracaedibacter symbiosus]|uniref:hypothetical protein n=1 Tax=Candidatus Paracaedibacter symbiosus TaxID=244582 RepID=UPI000509B1B0|nr:hypothetical protein [Candidatus Paracaedibacter symbiosus]
MPSIILNALVILLTISSTFAAEKPEHDILSDNPHTIIKIPSEHSGAVVLKLSPPTTTPRDYSDTLEAQSQHNNDGILDSNKSGLDHIIIDTPDEDNHPSVFDEYSSETTPRGIKAERLQSSNKATDNEEKDLENGGILPINNMDDVENAGCGICCLRTGRSLGSITAGVSGFTKGIGSACRTGLVSLSTLGEYSPEAKKWLGITSTIVSVITIISGQLADIASDWAVENQKALKQIEERIAEIIAQSQTASASPNLKGIRHKLSPNIQKEYENLQARYEHLTSLTSLESWYFSFSKCCLPNTYIVSKILELLFSVGNLVMIPISTIPTWDPTTALALNICVISLEALSYIFQGIAEQSPTLNKSIINLKNELDKYS